MHEGWRSEVPSELTIGTTLVGVAGAKGMRNRVTWTVRELDPPGCSQSPATGRRHQVRAEDVGRPTKSVAPSPSRSTSAAGRCRADRHGSCPGGQGRYRTFDPKFESLTGERRCSRTDQPLEDLPVAVRDAWPPSRNSTWRSGSFREPMRATGIHQLVLRARPDVGGDVEVLRCESPRPPPLLPPPPSPPTGRAAPTTDVPSPRPGEEPDAAHQRPCGRRAERQEPTGVDRMTPPVQFGDRHGRHEPTTSPRQGDSGWGVCRVLLPPGSVNFKCPTDSVPDAVQSSRTS